MSTYFIAQIEVEDLKGYKKYLESASEVFSKYNGKYLAVDDSPMCLEGFWDEKRIVLIEFPNRADFKKWYCSKDYQSILEFRLESAICDSILVEGMQN